MHTALWKLLWLDFRGSLRGLMRGRRKWRQLLLFLFMLAFVGLFVAARMVNSSGEANGRFGPAMPFWALVYLLATWLTASADRGLVMRPADIHFVVGGPFRERDVITLNLVRLGYRALISALVLSLLAKAYVASYLSALIGIWMMIAVSLLVGMIVSLSSRSSSLPWIKRMRRVFNVLAVGALLLLIAQSLQSVKLAGESPRLSTIAAAAQQTEVGQWLLPPLAWMFAPLSAESFYPETLSMLPPRLVVLGLLVGLVYLLGGRYLEATTRRTDVSVAKRQSALRSGVAGTTSGSSWTSRLSLPRLPRMGGVGSVAWMQMVHSVRVLPRFIVFTFTIVGIVLVVPLMVDASRLDGWGSVAWMAGLCLYADFLLLLQLPVGFLAPVAQREMLKSLPIPSWRIVFGLLAGPIIPLGLIHLAVTLLFLVVVPQSRGLVLWTSLALLPAAGVLIANVNLLGSWNIIRPRALQQRDALAAGRAMASVWIFFLMLIPAIVLGTLLSVVAGRVFGDAILAYVFGASLGVAISGSLYVLLLARSFRRWQPSSAETGKEEAEFDR